MFGLHDRGLGSRGGEPPTITGGGGVIVIGGDVSGGGVRGSGVIGVIFSGRRIQCGACCRSFALVVGLVIHLLILNQMFG